MGLSRDDVKWMQGWYDRVDSRLTQILQGEQAMTEAFKSMAAKVDTLIADNTQLKADKEALAKQVADLTATTTADADVVAVAAKLDAALAPPAA